MRLYVATTEGSPATIMVSEKTTLGELKVKVQEQGLCASPQHPRSMSIIFNGTRLREDGTTIAERGIRDGSTVHLVVSSAQYLEPRTVRIFVKKPSGELVPLNMNLCRRVADAAKDAAIASGFEISPGSLGFRLAFRGKVMDEEKTLKQHWVELGNVLHLVADPTAVAPHPGGRARRRSLAKDGVAKVSNILGRVARCMATM